MKVGLGPLLKTHYRSYVDARDGVPRWQDHATFAAPPVLVASACLVAEAKLPAAASVGLLTVSGLLSAFLFGVMLQVLERALQWADEAPGPGPETSSHAIFLEEIAANAGYASLVSVVASALFVVATVTTGIALVVFTALGLAIALHLALVLVMVMRRVFALIQGRLNRVRTTGTVTRMPQRRNSG